MDSKTGLTDVQMTENVGGSSQISVSSKKTAVLCSVQWFQHFNVELDVMSKRRVLLALNGSWKHTLRRETI